MKKLFLRTEDMKTSQMNLFSVLVPEFELMHVDEFIDDLLHAERMCDVILPRLQVPSAQRLTVIGSGPVLQLMFSCSKSQHISIKI